MAKPGADVDVNRFGGFSTAGEVVIGFSQMHNSGAGGVRYLPFSGLNVDGNGHLTAVLTLDALTFNSPQILGTSLYFLSPTALEAPAQTAPK